MSGKTCFSGEHEAHSAWITLLNTGLDHWTSACGTLFNLAWLLKGYTSWQVARLWLARRPSPRRSPLATLLYGIYLIRGSRWPELLTGSVKAAGITWGWAGNKVKSSKKGEGVGDWWWPMTKIVLSLSAWLKFLPPSFERNYICWDSNPHEPLQAEASRSCAVHRDTLNFRFQCAHIWFGKTAAMKSRCAFIP